MENKHALFVREILAEGKRIMKLLGKKSFTQDEYKKAGGRYQSSIVRRFGWNNFLKKIGANPLREMNIPDSVFIAEGKRVMKILGKKSFTIDEYKKAGGRYVYAICERLGWLNFFSLIGGFPRISSETEFLNICKNHEAVKALVEVFQGNETDIVNILSVISEGTWNTHRMIKWFNKPKLTEWIGEFKKPDLTPQAILEASFKLMPYEKNDMIKTMLLKSLMAWADKERGAKPTEQTKMRVIRVLEETAGKLLLVA